VKRSLLKKEKTSFLNEKITEAEGKKLLFSIVDSFLINKPGLKLPQHNSFSGLVERFSDRFLKKNTDIRASMNSTSCSSATEIPRNIHPFSFF
jgi:hypothetical protein